MGISGFPGSEERAWLEAHRRRAKKPKAGRPRKHLETVEELAEFLQVSRATLYRLMDLGLPYVQVAVEDRGGRRFDREDVLKWLASRSA